MSEAMTPKEAEDKQCPFIVFRPDPINHPLVEQQSCCIGPACMAWRWQPSCSHNNPSRVPGQGTTEIKYERGYCGIAGKP